MMALFRSALFNLGSVVILFGVGLLLLPGDVVEDRT